MKTIGVLGGLGPQATMDFEAEIPLLLQEQGNAADLINPAQLLAEAVVRYALE